MRLSEIALRFNTSKRKHCTLNNPTKKTNSGFTLIELIVVIFIVGLLVTMATISISTSTDEEIKTEAKRFAALVKLASEEAIMNTVEMAVEVGPKSYSFGMFVQGQFQPMEEDKLFRRRELPKQMKIEGEVADEKLDFSDFSEDLENSEEDQDLPKIFLLSSGETVPFDIIFSQEDGTQYQVVCDTFGKVEFKGKVKSADF